MKISFENRRVTLVATLFDLRSGWAKLSVFARDQLGIDLMAGEDAVVFVSKTRQIAKVLMADSSGITLIPEFGSCGGQIILASLYGTGVLSIFAI